jgi:hypothetical protein
MVAIVPVLADGNPCIIVFNIGWSFGPIFLVRRKLYLCEIKLEVLSTRNHHAVRAIHALIRYERGAMTLDTRGRRAKPYAAAPRNVAVPASGGRAMTLIRELN